MTDRNESYSEDESRLLTSPDEERAPVRGEHTAYFYKSIFFILVPQMHKDPRSGNSMPNL